METPPHAEPTATDVRRRMLRHLGLLPDGRFDQSMIDDVLTLPLTPTDRSLIQSEVAIVGVAALGDPEAMRLPSVVVTASPAATVTVRPTTEPAVSVVIVSYGTGTILVDTIASIAAAAAVSERPIEVIVVDNPHSTLPDRAMTSLRLFTAGVRVVQPVANTGFGGGCEWGAIFARADVITFANPDIVVPTGWLEPMVEALDDPSVSIVAPMFLNPDGTIQAVGQVLAASGLTSPRLEAPADEQLIVVDYASAACWVMRKSEHERLGGFDAAYHPAYYEDVDFALRAAALGGSSVVCPQVHVVHANGRGSHARVVSVEVQRDILLSKWPNVARRQV